MPGSATRARTAARIEARAAAAITYFEPIILEGRYDDLSTGAATAPGLLTFSKTAQRHADALSAWLRTATLPARATWAHQSARDAAPHRALYERFALAFELEAMRPGLLTESPLQCAPHAMVIGDDVIDGYLATGSSATEADRTHISQIYLCAIWRAVAPYRIFETDRSVLAEIGTDLGRIARSVKTLRERSAQSRTAPALPLFGIRALLELERGRIARAIGGRGLARAEERLTRALRIYEERIAAHAARRRADKMEAAEEKRAIAGVLRFSSYRSAQALLQLAYLDVLRADCTNAEARVRSASMLALTTADNVLESEIKLVSLIARRLQLRDPSGSEERRTELYAIRHELESLQALEVKRARPIYARMAGFQHALTFLYRTSATAVPAVTEAIDFVGTLTAANTRRSTGSGQHDTPATAFWAASGFLLAARTYITAARWADRENNLTRATSAVRDARAIIAPPTDRPRFGHLGNLAADCRILTAWIAIEQQDFRGAARLLAKHPRGLETAGYTTLPASDAFVALLSIAVAEGQGRWFVAQELLSRFATEFRPRLRVGWLLDLYAELATRAATMAIVDGVTRAEVEAEYLAVLGGTVPLRTARRFTVDAIHERLNAWLYEVTRDVVNAHRKTTGDVPSIRDLMDLWGLGRTKVRNLQAGSSFERRSPGSRRARPPKERDSQ